MRTLLLPLGLAALWLSPFLLSSGAAAQPALTPSASASSPAAPPLTLAQAQDLAASRSFTLSAAQRELEANDGAVQQAAAWRNPALNASIEDTRRATRTTTATLDLPLELGGQRAARMGAAERAREVAVAGLAGARAQLRAEVHRAFFEVLVAQERVSLTANSAALASRAAQAMSQRVAAGKLSPVDATRASVDQATAQLEAAEAAAQLQGAREALAALWGEAEPRFGLVEGDITQVPSRPALVELAKQIEQSPQLAASRSLFAHQRALVEVERGKALPELTLSLGAKRDHEMGRTQAIVGVSIPLPLFDRNTGGTLEASKRAEKASDEYQAARVRTLTELQQASAQLALARASAQTLSSAVLPAAQQAYDAASRGFEAGKFGFLDVIDAQRALLQARDRYLVALATAYQAATAIDRLLGL